MTYTPMQLAEVFIKTGELTDALDALNQQISDQPEDHIALRMRASVLLRLDSPKYLQQAIDDLHQLSDMTVDDYIQQSVIYERMGQNNEAVEAIRSAHNLSKTDERILERLVELLTHGDRYTEVLEILENAPQTWQWLLRRADVYALNNKPEQALNALNQAQAHLETVFPDLLSPVSRNTMAQIHIARGHVHMTLDNLKSAEADFKDALFHIPNDVTIQFNLGLIYARKKRLSRAVNYCKKALNNSSDYVRQTLIDVLNTDERYAELKSKLKLSQS